MDLEVNWEPGIGDPTFMGWFTVVAYFAVAVLCLLTRRAIRDRLLQSEQGRQPKVWGAMTLLMVALGINKQLDLQSWFTAVGRAVFTKYGWMEIHGTVQFWCMLVFTTIAALALATLAWRVRAKRREYWLLMAGVAFTVTFIVDRAASFHHFDRFLHSDVIGVKMNWTLELGGIALIGLAAWRRRSYARRRVSEWSR